MKRKFRTSLLFVVQVVDKVYQHQEGRR